MITGFRPAASARPWRSCTFSLREAAISTSTSPADVVLGPTRRSPGSLRPARTGCTGWPRTRPGSRVPVGQATGKDDLLGDHRRWRQRQRDVAWCGAALLDDAAHGLGHFVELLDVAVGDPAAFQRFDGAALQDQLAAGLTAELDQLDAGRTDVQPQQGGRRAVGPVRGRGGPGGRLSQPAGHLRALRLPAQAAAARVLGRRRRCWASSARSGATSRRSPPSRR
jgi:hypothetical protein